MNKPQPVQIVADEFARILGRHFARSVIEGAHLPGTVEHVAGRLDELFEIAKAEARRAFAERVIGTKGPEG